MIYIIYACIFIAVNLIAVSLFLSESRNIQERLPKRVPKEAPAAKRVKISFNINPLSFLSSFLLDKLNLKERIQQKLYAAKLKLNAVEFFNLKLTLMIAFAVVGYFTFSQKQQFLVGAFLLGYLLPDAWLHLRIKNNKEVISRLLPETVDLLGLCIEAGLDFTAAMEWIVKKTKHTPMIEELAFVLEEIKWGKSRSQALKDMARRLDLPEVTSFANTLVQAERMGTPVVEVFGVLSEDARLQRYHKGERYALQAPIKMLFPLVFCILPVIGIIIGGPILIRFTQGGLLGKF